MIYNYIQVVGFQCLASVTGVLDGHMKSTQLSLYDVQVVEYQCLASVMGVLDGHIKSAQLSLYDVQLYPSSRISMP